MDGFSTSDFCCCLSGMEYLMTLSQNSTLVLKMAYWKFAIKLVTICVVGKE